MMMSFVLAVLDEAATGHDAHPAGVLDAGNWLPGVTALIVFLIAFGVLATQVWPKITRALDEREAKIRNEIKSAEEAREQAKAALAQYEKELASARDEASRMIQKAKAEAKAAGDDLRARNEAELTDLRARAQREIQSAKAAAIAELHAHAATIGADIASRILQRKITVEDQQRLVEESLSQLQVGRR